MPLSGAPHSPSGAGKKQLIGRWHWGSQSHDLLSQPSFTHVRTKTALMTSPETSVTPLQHSTPLSPPPPPAFPFFNCLSAAKRTNWKNRNKCCWEIRHFSHHRHVTTAHSHDLYLVSHGKSFGAKKTTIFHSWTKIISVMTEFLQRDALSWWSVLAWRDESWHLGCPL